MEHVSGLRMDRMLAQGVSLRVQTRFYFLLIAAWAILQDMGNCTA
jgi:hypothetical protein